MDIKEEIKILQDYTSKIDKHNNMEVYKTIQHNFLDGYIGIMMNMIDGNSTYGVYLYIKTKDTITCPLLYKEFKDILSATRYYKEIINLIENNNSEYIINRCKMGL